MSQNKKERIEKTVKNLRSVKLLLSLPLLLVTVFVVIIVTFPEVGPLGLWRFFSLVWIFIVLALLFYILKTLDQVPLNQKYQEKGGSQ